MSWQHNISLSSVNQVLWALAVPLPPFFTATYEHLHLFDVSAHVSPSSNAPSLSNRALHQQLTKRLIASLYGHSFVPSSPRRFVLFCWKFRVIESPLWFGFARMRTAVEKVDRAVLMNSCQALFSFEFICSKQIQPPTTHLLKHSNCMAFSMSQTRFFHCLFSDFIAFHWHCCQICFLCSASSLAVIITSFSFLTPAL